MGSGAASDLLVLAWCAAGRACSARREQSEWDWHDALHPPRLLTYNIDTNRACKSMRMGATNSMRQSRGGCVSVGQTCGGRQALRRLSVRHEDYGTSSILISAMYTYCERVEQEKN